MGFFNNKQQQREYDDLLLKYRDLIKVVNSITSERDTARKERDELQAALTEMKEAETAKAILQVEPTPPSPPVSRGRARRAKEQATPNIN